MFDANLSEGGASGGGRSGAVLSGGGLIGPNAILQLLPVLDRFGGPVWREGVLAEAGIAVPDGNAMIPEAEAARLHRHLRMVAPEAAAQLAREAGVETANYILAHRIPPLAQWLLKGLPPWAAARALARAIERHAWTFAGSGTFRVVTPWVFEIARNPLIAGEESEGCLCHWHRGVFTQLYRTLVAADCMCEETQCGAQPGAACCRFELRRAPLAGGARRP